MEMGGRVSLKCIGLIGASRVFKPILVSLFSLSRTLPAEDQAYPSHMVGRGGSQRCSGKSE